MNSQSTIDRSTQDRESVETAGGSARGRAVQAFAAALARGQIGAGDVAALRRLVADDPSGSALWKVLNQYVTPYWTFPDFGPALDEAERRWAVILNALAHLSGLHAPGRPLGAALAEAGLSELRLTRLLRAEDDALADAVRMTARYLASKGQQADLTEVADLVLSDGHKDRERVRRRIARSYYRHLPNS